ncbi:MAG: hypothetical protein OXC29_29600 [Rhodococcus sp.]|nr:hypothetical protein [Rhodococcus sp. (in: high G+C Gram-positive bacteria)]
MEQVVVLFVGAVIGWVLAVARDRSAAIRAQQIKVIVQLQERVIEIAGKELSDGNTRILAVHVQGGTRRRDATLSAEEVDYQARLGQWREELDVEKDRARLWLDTHTVSLVSTYVLVMMQCGGWAQFGQGILTEDKNFKGYLRAIFGSAAADRVLKDVTITRSDNSEPLLVDCVELSNLCLSEIQRRIRREITQPFRFCISNAWRRVTGAVSSDLIL